MPKGEAPEQSIVQRIGTVRGPDKDDVVAESVKLLHQGNRHTVHFRNIILAAAPCPDSVNLIEAEHARTFSRIVEYHTDILLRFAQSGIHQTGEIRVYERKVRRICDIPRQLSLSGSRLAHE